VSVYLVLRYTTGMTLLKTVGFVIRIYHDARSSECQTAAADDDSAAVVVGFPRTVLLHEDIVAGVVLLLDLYINFSRDICFLMLQRCLYWHVQ